VWYARINTRYACYINIFIRIIWWYMQITIFTYPYTSQWLRQNSSVPACMISKHIHDTFMYIHKYMNTDEYTYLPKYNIHTDTHRHVQCIQIFMHIISLYLHKYMYTCLYISSNHTCKSPCIVHVTIYHVRMHLPYMYAYMRMCVGMCGCVCVGVYVWVCMCECACVCTRGEKDEEKVCKCECVSVSA